jgi:hypothetical protein
VFIRQLVARRGLFSSFFRKARTLTREREYAIIKGKKQERSKEP